MRYHIVQADSILSLISGVTDMLKEGWVPQGGVCIKARYGSITFYQAVIFNNVIFKEVFK